MLRRRHRTDSRSAQRGMDPMRDREPRRAFRHPPVRTRPCAQVQGAARPGRPSRREGCLTFRPGPCAREEASLPAGRRRPIPRRYGVAPRPGPRTLSVFPATVRPGRVSVPGRRWRERSRGPDAFACRCNIAAVQGLSQPGKQVFGKNPVSKSERNPQVLHKISPDLSTSGEWQAMRDAGDPWPGSIPWGAPESAHKFFDCVSVIDDRPGLAAARGDVDLTRTGG